MIRGLFISRVTLVWLLLLAATALSWEMGHGVGFHDARDAGVAIIVVALIKVRFVLLDFMEIRYAPRPMRIVAECAVLVLCAALLFLYLRIPV